MRPRRVRVAASAGLAFLCRGDLPVAEGAEVYGLHPADLVAEAVRPLAAADVAAQLAPAPPSTDGSPFSS